MYAARYKADGVASRLIAAKADLNAKNEVRHDARMVVARGALSGVCGSCIWEMQAWAWSVRDVAMQPDENRQAMDGEEWSRVVMALTPRLVA